MSVREQDEERRERKKGLGTLVGMYECASLTGAKKGVVNASEEQNECLSLIAFGVLSAFSKCEM